MEAFSRTLLELHELAEQVAPAAFASRALPLVRRWIGFDGAVFGTGEAVDPERPLQITQAHVDARSAGILDDYARVAADDPVTLAFLAGPARPIRIDCRATYRSEAHAALDGFTREHRLRHLMLFGEPPAEEHPGRWLVLYRENGKPFTSADSEAMHGLWLHLARAIGAARTGRQLRLMETMPTLPELTRTQNEVARRFAAGLSYKHIAREMNVSPNTVRTHLLNAYARLGIHDKLALATRFGLQR